MTRALTVGCVLALAALLAGCDSHTALLDPSPLRNYVVVRVNNDTNRRVTVTLCSNRRCRDSDAMDKVSANDYVEDAVNNASPGVAWFRIQSAAGRVRCLALFYRAGQRKASLQVSDAITCR